MDSTVTTEYLKYRLAFLKDKSFRLSCEEYDIDNDYVRRYLDLRDYFENMWRRLAEDVTCNAFGSGPEALALIDLLRTYVPSKCSSRNNESNTCALTHRQSDLTALEFISNPEKIWESLKLFEQLQQGGSLENFLKNIEKDTDRDERLTLANDLITKLKLAWLTFNVESFIDFNLERFFQSQSFQLFQLANSLSQCFTAAVSLTRII